MLSLYLSFGVMMAIGSSMMGQIVLTSLVANWFERKRGTALGLAQLGQTTSGVLMVPLAAWLEVSLGWRSTLAVYAAVLALVLVPLIWLVIRNRPQDLAGCGKSSLRTLS